MYIEGSSEAILMNVYSYLKFLAFFAIFAVLAIFATTNVSLHSHFFRSHCSSRHMQIT